MLSGAAFVTIATKLGHADIAICMGKSRQERTIMKRAGFLCAAYLVALTIVSSHTLAEGTCDKWNSLEFFEQAGTDDVERCLVAGADPNARIEARDFTFTSLTPLHAATMFGAELSTIELLLAAGADPTSRSEEGVTPIHLAGANRTFWHC